MSTVQTQTLTDFLLARIAEDEAAARYTLAQESDWDRRNRFVEWQNQDEYNLLCVDPARGLAECEAKRRLVRMRAQPYREHTLKILALPYAEHPDYREDWRA